MSEPRAHGISEDVGSRDGGYATIWTAALVMVLLAATVLGIHLGAALSTRHRVEAAADLAALATAGHAAEGETSACRYGARVAERMAVRIMHCRLESWDARLEVEAPGPLALGPWDVAHARARAGPVDDGPG